MTRAGRAVLSVLGMAFITGGCAAPTTQVATIAPERVREEESLQRELALRTQWDQQQRLDSIARPILAGARPLCGDAVAPDFGFRFGDVHGLDAKWILPAKRGLGLDEQVRVIAVTPGSPAEAAGLRSGDILRQVGSHVIDPGKSATERLGKHLATYGAEEARVPIRIEREGDEQTVELTMEPVCSFSTHVVSDGELNAYADGKAIVVTTAMMRFADDPELAVIVAHELAHNAMGHMDAMRSNQMAGGLLGLLGDLAMALSGVNTGGYYTLEGMKAGARVYSQDFEREADYVGLYALALADLPLDDAPTFWRHMAVANPSAIGLAGTHPTTAERFVRMETAIHEIVAKQERGQPLTPERKQ